MARKLPAQGDDTEMNMTPMIDMVFQLIVFFLVLLKFKEIDERIDTELPKKEGLAATPSQPSELQHIKVKLFRHDAADKARAFTRIRIGNDVTVDMPRGSWPESAGAANERQILEAHDEKFRQVTAHITRIWEAQNKNPEVKGEIEAPKPLGLLVPHADVIRILDCFIEAGLTQVHFEGTEAPLSRAEGGHGP
jgi:hypothetical protein